MKRLLLTSAVMLSLSVAASAQSQKATKAPGSKAQAGIVPVQKAATATQGTTATAPVASAAPLTVVDKKTNRKVYVNQPAATASKATANPAAAMGLVEAQRAGVKTN